MNDSPAISELESAAADLGKLLSGWTRDRLAEAEAAHANPADPDARSRRPGLATINAGIQSLWRLVSVQKSILQLKNPPSAPAPDRPPSEFRFGVQTSVSPNRQSSIDNRQSSDSHSPNRQSSIVNRQSSDSQSPNRQSSIDNRQSSPSSSSVPSVPVVPSVPTYRSIEEIAAKTKKLYAQTAALMAANGLAVPGNADLPIGKTPSTNVPPPSAPKSSPAMPDQLKSKLLKAITSRPTFPGSGNLLDSIRAEILTSPP